MAAVLILAAAVLGMLFAATSVPSSARADDGIDLTVTVEGTSGTGSSSGSGSSGGTASSPPPPSMSPAPPEASAPVTPESGFTIGGLSSSVGWSPDPLAGTVTLSFTARNQTRGAVTFTPRFSAEGPFGSLLSSATRPAITLQPGDSRVVSATLGGIGQSGLVHARVHVTQPDRDGVAVPAIDRDSFIVVPPWHVIALAGVLVAAFLLLRRSPAFLALFRAPRPA